MWCFDGHVGHKNAIEEACRKSKCPKHSDYQSEAHSKWVYSASAKKRDSVVAAQINAPSRKSTPLIHDLTPQLPTESVLEPELSDFCSRLHFTPAIRDFYDEDQNDPGLLSNRSSDIEEESKLDKFTQILWERQAAALKREATKRQGKYLKRSKQTLQCHNQVWVKLSMKGFLPVDEFMRQKKIPIKQNKLTPNSKKLDKPDEDAYTNSSISGASKVESNKTLPRSPCKIQFHPAWMESEESSGHNNKDNNADTIKIVNTDANANANKIDDTDANNANNDNNNNGVEDYARQQIRYKTDLLDKKETHTTHNHLEDLQHKFILEH